MTLNSTDTDIREEESIIASNSLYYISRYASKFLFSFIVGIFLVRFLGPSNYGLYSLSMVYWGMFSAVFSMGFGSTIQYAVSKYRAKKDPESAVWIVKHYLLMLSISSIIGAIVMFLLSGTIAQIYRIPQLSLLIKVLAVGLLFYSLSESFSANVYIGYQKMKYTFITGITYDVLRLVQVAVVVAGLGILGAIAFYDIIYIIVGIMSVYLVYRILHKNSSSTQISASDMGEFRSYNRFSYESNLISFTYGSVMMLLLGFLAPDISFVGFYRAGLLMASVLSTPASALIAAPFATSTKFLIRKEMDNVYRVQSVLIRYAAMITIPLVVGAMISARQLVIYLYRSQLLGAQTPFQIILLSVLVSGILAPLTSVLSAMGKQKYSMYSIGIGAIIAITFTIVFVPSFLAVGAAITYLISSLSAIAVNLFFLSRYIRIKIPYVAVAKSFGAAAIMGLYLYLMLSIVTNLKVLPIILISGLILYVIIIYLLKVLTKSDIRFLLKVTHLYNVIIRK